jgi:hypothetical protein
VKEYNFFVFFVFVLEICKKETDENEKKLALMGLDLSSLSQQTPKQRELMMRLQQHGQLEGEEEKPYVIIKKERRDSCSSDDIKTKTKGILCCILFRIKHHQ